MVKLVDFKLNSFIDYGDRNEKQEIVAKGYKKTEKNKTILYFKQGNKFKFIVYKDYLETMVNDSHYTFKLNEKTEAIIDKQISVSVYTNELVISDSLIKIKYILDFKNFKSNYEITLEIY